MNFLHEVWKIFFLVHGRKLETHQPKVSLLDHFVEGRMEAAIIHIREVRFIFQFLFQLLVALFDGFQVTIYWKLSIYRWILRARFGLVKIIYIIDVSGSLFFENYFPVWPYQHCYGSRSSCAPRRSILIHGYVCSNNYSISSIPVRRRNPVKGVNESIGGSVTSVNAGSPFK